MSDYAKLRQDAAREYDEKGKQLFALDEKFKAQKSEGTWTDADQERFDAVAAEAMDAKARYDEAKRMEGFESDLSEIAAPVGSVKHIDAATKARSIREQLFPEGKSFEKGELRALDFGGSFLSAKAVDGVNITAAAAGGSLVTPDYTGNLVSYPVPPTIAETLFGSRRTDVNVWKYFIEDKPTYTAAEVANSLATDATKPESQLAFELATEYAHVIAHYIPVHKTALANVPMLEGIIRDRLLVGLRLRVDQQLLWGDGTGDNITGLANRAATSGGIPGIATYTSTGTSATTFIDDVKGMATKSYVNTWVEPTAVAMTPQLRDLLLTAKTAGSGQYIYGVVPFVGGAADGPAFRVWGLNIVATPFAENPSTKVGNVFVGNPMHGTVVTQSDADVTAGWTDKQFIQNAETLLAETTVGLEIDRPYGFVQMTVSGVS